MRTYKLYGSTAAAADNAANLSISKNGFIRNIRWAISIDCPTDNGTAVGEISLQPTGQHGTNDTIGVIDAFRSFQNLVTSGLAFGAFHFSRSGMAFPVQAGEKLYLNLTNSNATSYVTCFIDVDERGGG